MAAVDRPSTKHWSTVHDLLQNLAARPRWAAIALLDLCLAVYMPGVMRLPPVDRTEVVYAETTRDMLARGALTDPRYGVVVHQFRPIGTYWAQALSATLAGPSHARDITVYRLPGLIAVTLSVLALFWLATPLIGTTQALIAASLFAVAPLTVLLSQLAITEGLALLPATIAMLALLRLYASDTSTATRRIALLFWFAVGFGVLLNALQTPILIAATLIALYIFDRDLAWLKRTRPRMGVPLALLIASPWLIVRTLQDGVPFAGLGFKEFLEALGGSQDMKLRAFPGTFVFAMLLGFLPGTALLAPALTKLWNDRDAKLARFLLAWTLGYLVYLEAISSKPGTYSVQVLFPALALAVAMLVTSDDGKMPPPKFHAFPWPPLAALFALVLFAAPYAALREFPPLWIAPLIAAVAALFYWSAHEGRLGHLTRWALSGTAALALFAVTLLGGVLPSIDKIWPARQIQRFVATSCDPGTRFGLLGFREPSANFLLQADATGQSPEALVASQSDVQIVERRWLDRYTAELAKRGEKLGSQYGCLNAYNVMRGCALSFAVIGQGVSEADRCFKLPPTSCDAALAPDFAAKACD